MSAGARPERHVRIPLFARVQARVDAPVEASCEAGTMYAWNISDGGVYLKAPDVSANDVPLGKGMALAFSLPDGGPAIEVSAEIVWVDPVVRDHRGRTAVGLGLRFDSVHREAEERIQSFIASFRYRVVTLGVEDPSFAQRAFGDLFTIQEVASEEELALATESGHVGLVLLGEKDGASAALELLKKITEDTDIERQPPVLYCGKGTHVALESLVNKNGRVAYAQLPLEPLELRTQVQRAIEAYVLAFENELLTSELRRAVERLRRENQYLREAMSPAESMEGMVGESPAMQRVYEMIQRIAPFPTTVMIVGETGTGKELVARAIHRLSPRVERAFVAQNCAALAETLLDSELFGHSRGAYTGATQDRCGIFEAADGGTVFLDEVGEMPPSMQAKLLRVLQDGELRRIGETKTRKVDVRLLCATHRDLEGMVKAGTFREDLFYRLRTFVLALPPLRERREDIPILAMHFLTTFADKHGRAAKGITTEAMRLLQAHEWHGNARELEHTIERLLVLGRDGEKIDGTLVAETLGVATPAVVRERPSGMTLCDALEGYERQLIAAELERGHGVIAAAARALGVDRTTLSKRVKRLGLKARE